MQMILLTLLLAMFDVATTSKQAHLKLKHKALNWALGLLMMSMLLLTPLSVTVNTNLFEWTLLGVDGISTWFMVLTFLLTPLCMLVSWESMKYLMKEFMLCLLMTQLLLFLVFTARDMLFFYVCFEATLIPVFLIMGMWGGSQEKIKAAYYFFFFTLLGSVFMLMAMFKTYALTGTTDYSTLTSISLPYNIQMWLFTAFFLSFAVKMPMLPFHMWLPQAHVEAPVAGSVLLAGILLKLGGYGFMSFSLPLFPLATTYFSPLMIALSMAAIVYGSLTTCSQTDVKRLMAYSSVAHMGLVTLGMFTQTLQGLVAAMYMMMAHGLVSAALFMIVTIPYERFGTSTMRYYKGLVIQMPLFTLFFMTLTLANMAMPLTCNFMGEFMCLTSTFEYNLWVGAMATSSVMLSAVYALYLLNSMCFGDSSHFLFFTSDLTSSETYIQISMCALMLITGMLPFMITKPTSMALYNLNL